MSVTNRDLLPGTGSPGLLLWKSRLKQAQILHGAYCFVRTERALSQRALACFPIPVDSPFNGEALLPPTNSTRTRSTPRSRLVLVRLPRLFPLCARRVPGGCNRSRGGHGLLRFCPARAPRTLAGELAARPGGHRECARHLRAAYAPHPPAPEGQGRRTSGRWRSLSEPGSEWQPEKQNGQDDHDRRRQYRDCIERPGVRVLAHDGPVICDLEYKYQDHGQ